MCGIAGVARFDGGTLTEADDGLLRRFAELLRHRGPDDERLLRDGPVGLSFTRLSLVDPEGGAQPLISADGTVVLIANGEVYNHRELAAGLPAGDRPRTGSDCEVLLSLYQRDGLRFLDRVNGMFSLVLWDRARQRLLLCRDRFGIKPLFYHRDRERIVFGSEIKSLFADPGTPRRLAWERLLASPGMTSVPELHDEAPETGFEGIELVPAATILDISLRDGATSEHRYWKLPAPDTDATASDAEYVARYRELLAEAVSDCVMADAEVGLFLSGGIDSSAVAALATTTGLHTFTVLDGSTVLSGDAEWGHRAAGILGLPNHQVLFDRDRAPTPAEWKHLLWLTETPRCGPEQYYKYELHRYARATRPEIKGMLLGAAADEFNGGYSVETAGGGGWDSFMANLAVMGRRRALRRRPDLAPWWDYGPLPLLREELLNGGRPLDEPYAGYLSWKWRTLQQYNLWHEDRTAAGNGIEARVPFLDHRLVELVAAIPAARRRNLLWDKAILRTAMRDLLPPELTGRTKVPFYHGDGERQTYRTFTRMLAQDGDALVEEALSAPRAAEFLHADGIRAVLRRLEADPGSLPVEHLLRVLNMGLLDRMTAELPPPPSVGPVRLAPVALPITDWDAEVAELRRRTLQGGGAGPEEVLRLRSDTVLACVPAQPGEWFLAVNGSFEYVLDEAEDPAWLGFLRALDGKRTVKESLVEAGCDLDAVTGPLDEALELGILVREDR